MTTRKSDGLFGADAAGLSCGDAEVAGAPGDGLAVENAGLRERIVALEAALATAGTSAAAVADGATGRDNALRNSLEACPIGVAVLAAADGRRLFVNSAMVDMLGAGSRQELLQGDIRETWVDQAVLAEAWSTFQSGKSLVNFEAERIRADGTRWWVLMNTQPISFEGQDAGIVWHIDITPRKRAEEAARQSETRLTEAVESLSDAFALFDPDDRLIFCNRMFRELNPDLAANIRVGMTFEDMVRDNLAHGRIIDAIGREEAFVAERMAQHREPTGEPILSQRADGRWLLLREMRSRDGSTFLVNTDLTELKKREDALREQMEKAEQANGAKSQFLATMSHELRTPLNAIIGFSDILRRGLFGEIGDERYRIYAEDIYSSGQHLLDLINDVLDLSRIEAGRYELNLGPVDIGRVVRASCDVIREESKRKGLRFRTSIASNLPAIRADSRALRQIILNLLSNAIKFTPEGGEVRVRTVRDAQGRIAISVADTGIGVAEEDLEVILAPFSQIAHHDSANEGGTGLGLSIVNSLVELHGGTLDIDSTLGQGTRVTVRLPQSCVITCPFSVD